MGRLMGKHPRLDRSSQMPSLQARTARGEVPAVPRTLVESATQDRLSGNAEPTGHWHEAELWQARQAAIALLRTLHSKACLVIAPRGRLSLCTPHRHTARLCRY